MSRTRTSPVTGCWPTSRVRGNPGSPAWSGGIATVAGEPIDVPIAGYVGPRISPDRKKILTQIEVVVGAMLPQPKRLSKLDAALGRPLGPEQIEHLAERGFKQVRPQANIHGDPDWRRQMARVELHRGLCELALQSPKR